MTKLSFCTGSERGDLELNDTKPQNNLEREKFQRSYSCTKNLRNYVSEFCNSGTIHGIRYFGENRTLIEKLWWAISIGVSLYFCIGLIINTYIKWETSPVIVSFATKETPVWKLPFPAVTICPESKTLPSVFNYTKYLHMKEDGIDLTPEEEKKFGYLSFICDYKSKLDYSKSGKFTGTEIFDFFEQVHPKFSDYASDCKYLGESYNCSDLFVPMITDDGICYTFNIIDRTQLLSDLIIHHKNYHKTKVANDWNLEDGYSPSAGLDAYPRRSLTAGMSNGLQIKLKINEDDLDYTCGTSVKGFKVQVSHPQRMPRVKHRHFVVPLDVVAKAGIAPEMMATSEAIRQYDPKRRNCHLPSEASLKYFKVYSLSNCAIECKAKLAIEECGCVPFFIPRENGTRICGAASQKCLKNLKRKMVRGSIQKKLNEMNNIKSENNVQNCYCLPICSSMYYSLEYSQAKWDWRNVYKYNRQKNADITNPKIRMSLLQIYFRRNNFITSERNELYGATDFFANIGGLLGLFIGFSALSLVEIIYYLTLRIICNINMFGKRNWAGKTD